MSTKIVVVRSDSNNNNDYSKEINNNDASMLDGQGAHNIQGKTRLHRLVIDGDFEAVKILIEDESHLVNTADALGWSPLAYAVQNNDEEIVKLLLDAGANVNYRNEILLPGPTALQIAVQNCHKGIAKALLEHGADPNSIDSCHRSIIYFAAWSKRFIHSSDLNEDSSEDKEDDDSSEDNYVDILRMLLDHGAKLDDPSTAYPAFFNVLKYGNARALELFVERGFNPRQLRQDDELPLILCWAAANKDKNMLGSILSRGEIDVDRRPKSFTALHYAVKKNLIHATANLLDNGANIDARDSNGESAIFHAVFDGNLTMIEYLLARGADVNIKMPSGKSILNAAFKKSNPVIVNQIVRHMAKLEAVGKTLSPVNRALLRSDRGSLEFYERCKAELARTRSIYFYCDSGDGEEKTKEVSLFHVLTHKEARAYTDENDWEVGKVIGCFYSEFDFPCYFDYFGLMFLGVY